MITFFYYVRYGNSNFVRRRQINYFKPICYYIILCNLVAVQLFIYVVTIKLILVPTFKIHIEISLNLRHSGNVEI
jgi:hypothetical protein